MKFFDRANELQMLADIERRSRNNAQFTVFTGRRRVGKTSLLMCSFPKSEFVYLFVERKSGKIFAGHLRKNLNRSLGW